MKTEYDKIIEPAIAEIGRTRGMAAEVTRQFSDLSGRETKRQAIDAWLHKDRTKRVEPSYSKAISLMRAIEEAKLVMRNAR